MIVTLIVQRLKDRLAQIANEEGQALVEYALLISLVAVASAGAVGELGTGLAGLYSHIQAVYP